MTVAQVRPGLLGWPVFWFMYVAAGVLGGMACALVSAPLLIVAQGFAPQPAIAVVGAVVFIAAVGLAVRWAHPRITRFIDRANFRLTDDHLHLGRGDKVTISLSEVTDAWFGDRTFGASATGPATRRQFRVVVLGLASGWFVPVSPPPGMFAGGESADTVVAPVGAFVVGVDDFMKALLARLEPVLRDGDEMPWRMRALSGPADVNWVYGPGAPPLPKGSTLPNWTYI